MPRFPNRSRCDTCGYASGIKPGRACPECGGTMAADGNGLRNPDAPLPRAFWVRLVALGLLVLFVGLPLLIWVWNMLADANAKP